MDRGTYFLWFEVLLIVIFQITNIKNNALKIFPNSNIS